VTKSVTVIFGQKGGPSSSTSMAEALLVGCCSSTPLGRQVVRPRLSRGSQGWILTLDKSIRAYCARDSRRRLESAGVGWRRRSWT
jgi:hypothetical protein